MEETVLTAPDGTIAEMGDSLTSLLAEETALPDSVEETEAGSQDDETVAAAEDPAAVLEAALANLSDEQLAANPKLKKLIDAREYQVRQSEADKAKAASAAAASQAARSIASQDNRQLAISVVAEEFKKYQEGDAEYNPQRMNAALDATVAHAMTVGVTEIAKGLTDQLAAKYPDYQPDAVDAQAYRYAFDSRDMGRVVDVLVNVIEKAATAKIGPAERQRAIEEHKRLQADEEAVRTTQKAAAANAAKPRPTAVTNGATTAVRPRSLNEAATLLNAGRITNAEYISYKRSNGLR